MSWVSEAGAIGANGDGAGSGSGRGRAVSGSVVPLATAPGLMYVPARASRSIVLCHGAGGDAQQAIALLRSQADDHGLALAATKSEGPTWDLLVGGFGVDRDRIESACDELLAVVGGPVAIGGFSDGASYALSVGLAAGHRFDAIVAFSPGFMAPPRLVGQPRIFVSHGTADRVLPIDRCGRRVVDALTQSRYDVTYHEFVGGHDVPPEVQQAAVEWLAVGAGPGS